MSWFSTISSTERGQGSGFIFDGKRGYIATNAHVVKSAKRALVRMADGRPCNVGAGTARVSFPNTRVHSGERC